MPHVVTDNCLLCRFTECVAVCPVECFHADKERIYIDPEVCIDCGACIPACPVRAIYEVIDMPDDQRHWIEINAERILARLIPNARLQMIDDGHLFMVTRPVEAA